MLGGIEGAARAVVAAYDGVTTQLLLDQDIERARGRLGRLLTASLTDGSGRLEQGLRHPARPERDPR